MILLSSFQDRILQKLNDDKGKNDKLKARSFYSRAVEGETWKLKGKFSSSLISIYCCLVFQAITCDPRQEYDLMQSIFGW